MNFETAQLPNQLNALLFYGIVVAVNPVAGVVQVQDGELTTDWIPYTVPRFGGIKVYSCPSVGETVMVLSESGDIANAVVGPSLTKGGGGVAGQHTIVLGNTVLSYSESTGNLSITAPTIAITGNVVITGTVVANSISLTEHIHPGDSGGVTGPPVS